MYYYVIRTFRNRYKGVTFFQGPAMSSNLDGDDDGEVEESQPLLVEAAGPVG